MEGQPSFEAEEALVKEKGIDQEVIDQAMKKWAEEMMAAGVSPKEMEPYKGKGLKEILPALKEHAPDLKTFAILNRREELNSEDPEMKNLSKEIKSELESNVGWCMEDKYAEAADLNFRRINNYPLKLSYLYINKDSDISSIDIDAESILPYKEFSNQRKQLLERRNDKSTNLDRAMPLLREEFRAEVIRDMEKLGFYSFTKAPRYQTPETIKVDRRFEDNSTLEGGIQWAIGEKRFRLYQEAFAAKTAKDASNAREYIKKKGGFVF